MPPDPDADDTSTSDSRDELRTIAFRLREIQRLLGMRVTQENARLEADGLSPITEARFFKELDHEPRVSRRQTRRNVDALADLDPGESVRLALLNGQSVTGRAGPIDYTPDERLRVELAPEGGDSTRYEVRSELVDAEWTPPTVRRYRQGDDEWTALGVVRTVGQRSDSSR